MNLIHLLKVGIFCTFLDASPAELRDIIDTKNIAISFSPEDAHYYPCIERLSRDAIKKEKTKDTYYCKNSTAIPLYVFDNGPLEKYKTNIFTFEYNQKEKTGKHVQGERSFFTHGDLEMTVNFTSDRTGQKLKKTFTNYEFASSTDDIQATFYTSGQRWLQSCHERIKHSPYNAESKIIFNMFQASMITDNGSLIPVYKAKQDEEIFDFIWNDEHNKYSLLLHYPQTNTWAIKRLHSLLDVESDVPNINSVDIRLSILQANSSEQFVKPYCAYFVKPNLLSCLFCRKDKSQYVKNLVLGVYDIANGVTLPIVDLITHNKRELINENKLKTIGWPLIQSVFEGQKLSKFVIHGHWKMCTDTNSYVDEKIEISFSDKASEFIEEKPSQHNSRFSYIRLSFGVGFSILMACILVNYYTFYNNNFLRLSCFLNDSKQVF